MKHLFTALVCVNVFGLLFLSHLCGCGERTEAEYGFIPVLSGGSDQIDRPDAVALNEKTRTVDAATFQDALNAAVNSSINRCFATESINSSPAPEASEDALETVYTIQAGSGLGYVSTGCSFFTVENAPYRSAEARRKAAVIAYERAKSGLVKYLEGETIDASSETTEQSALQTSSNGDSSLQTEKSASEKLRIVHAGRLSGYVLYQIDEKDFGDGETRLFAVSIVSTPKTRDVAKASAKKLDFQALSAEVERTVQEMKNGLSFPVGNRIFSLKAGEFGFMGFSVTPFSPDGRVSSVNKSAALKMAEIRALDSLASALHGELIQGTFSMETTYKEAADFEASQTANETYLSIRKGVLPPSLIIKKWFDDNQYTASCIVIYLPSLSEQETYRLFQNLNLN